jgi:hypothetical protein
MFYVRGKPFPQVIIVNRDFEIVAGGGETRIPKCLRTRELIRKSVQYRNSKCPDGCHELVSFDEGSTISIFIAPIRN